MYPNSRTRLACELMERIATVKGNKQQTQIQFFDGLPFYQCRWFG